MGARQLRCAELSVTAVDTAISADKRSECWNDACTFMHSVAVVARNLGIQSAEALTYLVMLAGSFGGMPQVWRAIHSICHACPAHLHFHCCPALFYMSPSTDFLQCRSCINLQHFRVGRRMKLCCWYRHALLVRSWQNVATSHGSLHAMALKDNLVLQYYACAYGSLACCPGASTAWTWAQGRPFFLPGRVHKQHQVSCDTETLVDAHGAAGYLMRKYRIWMLHAWGLT